MLVLQVVVITTQSLWLRQSNVEKKLLSFSPPGEPQTPFSSLGTLDFLSTYLRINSLNTLLLPGPPRQPVASCAKREKEQKVLVFGVVFVLWVLGIQMLTVLLSTWWVLQESMGCLLSTITPHGDVLPLDLAPLQVQPTGSCCWSSPGQGSKKQYSLASFHRTHLGTGNSHSSLHLHIEIEDWA